MNCRKWKKWADAQRKSGGRPDWPGGIYLKAIKTRKSFRVSLFADALLFLVHHLPSFIPSLYNWRKRTFWANPPQGSRNLINPFFFLFFFLHFFPPVFTSSFVPFLLAFEVHVVMTSAECRCGNCITSLKDRKRVWRARRKTAGYFEWKTKTSHIHLYSCTTTTTTTRDGNKHKPYKAKPSFFF